ncbi:MAG: AAA family ATPase [Candidatus Portnoybacteria bacterium]|nr:AAA family ATPase [Candidatus Portnoybacteria bacterium]
MKNKELQEYIQAQIVQAPKRLKGLTNDMQGKPLFKRSVFLVLRKYVADFLKKGSEPRIIVMPGLRGTGKTTLLAQLFLSLPNENITKLYLSVEEAIKRFDVNLWDIIQNYEELIGKSIEEIDVPLILFLDEIHYDEKWAIFLKSMYDKSKKIMIFCTGSAALLLREQINADVARRVYFVDVHPVCFSEYMLFKRGKFPIKGIGQIIKDAILHSANAKDVYEKLQKENDKVKKYWLDIDTFEMHRYIKLGTFPFTLRSENEVLAVSFVSQVINKVIYTDIPQFYKFETETLNRIDKILYLISETLGVSVTKLSETLQMKPDTIRIILKSLESSGLVLRIAPYGAHFRQVRKPSKYLFATPSLRFSYLSSRESIGIFENYQGSLFEDITGMYLNRVLPKFGGFSLTYDVSEGGADFIVTIGNEKVVIEVGAGKKGYKQIISTAQKVNPKYSIIISNNELEYSQEYNAVKIPLNYFLLM